MRLTPKMIHFLEKMPLYIDDDGNEYFHIKSDDGSEYILKQPLDEDEEKEITHIYSSNGNKGSLLIDKTEHPITGNWKIIALISSGINNNGLSYGVSRDAVCALYGLTESESKSAYILHDEEMGDIYSLFENGNVVASIRCDCECACLQEGDGRVYHYCNADKTIIGLYNGGDVTSFVLFQRTGCPP